jgi:hypothetical protein
MKELIGVYALALFMSATAFVAGFYLGKDFYDDIQSFREGIEDRCRRKRADPDRRPG